MRDRDINSNSLDFYNKSYAKLTSGESRAFQPGTPSEVSMEVNVTWKFSHLLIKRATFSKQ